LPSLEPAARRPIRPSVAEPAPEGDETEAEDGTAVARWSRRGGVAEAEDVAAAAAAGAGAAGPGPSGGEQVSMMELLMSESDYMPGPLSAR